MKLNLKTVPCLLAALVMASCEKPGTTENGGFQELVPETPEYVNAELAWYGLDQSGYSENSDRWVLTLSTDGIVMNGGTPSGSGQVITLVMNAARSDDGSMQLGSLAGEYVMPGYMSSSDYTYVQGEMTSIDTPAGYVDTPSGSWFASLDEAGAYEPDLLREGSFTVSDNGDGTFTVDGVLVGGQYLKRYFSYTGTYEPEDLSGELPGPSFPNSNLSGDVSIEGLDNAMLHNLGDYWMTGDCRVFLLLLAEDGVDIESSIWPSGTGRVLRLELLVPIETVLADGIPAGTYTMLNRLSGGGVSSDDIYPYQVLAGRPDVFASCSGSWYQEITDGAWTSYGLIDEGTVTVTRDGDAHTLDIRLGDCSDPSNSISGVWSTEGPIPYPVY